MKKELIFIAGSYTENTASANRLLALVRGISETGVKVKLVLIYSGSNNERFPVLPNVDVEYLWENRCAKNIGIKVFLGFWDLYRYIRQQKATDIVFLYGAGQYLPMLVNKCTCPVYHERTEHPSVVKVIPPFLQGRYLKSCSKTKGMFVISTALKKYFESIGVKRVGIVNMVVDGNRFFNLKKNAGCDDYIIYCGKATNNKDGVNDLIRAFAIVAAKHDNIQLKIVGQAPNRKDGYENLKLVEDLGLTDRVLFMGIKQTSEIPLLLKNARACVLDRPDSLQAQCGFPTKLGEYLLSGNPVIVTKVGDIPIFLSHKYNGLLAEERDAEDFAAQISWVLDNPNEAAQIGERGKALAEKEFNYLNESKKIVKMIFNE